MTEPRAFFEWLASTDVSHLFNGANYVYFGLVMAVHLIGIALLGGIALTVDLRLLGLRLGAMPAGQLALGLRPWFRAGLAVAVGTGLWMLVADPLKYYVNPAFRAKAALLLLAVPLQWLLHRIALRGDSLSFATGSLAVASLLLWLAAAAAGRIVGLL